MVSPTACRDVGSLVLLAASLLVSKRTFLFRGMTYRSTVPTLGLERTVKVALYLGTLGLMDAVLRFVRKGLVLRTALGGLFGVWALNGPLNSAKHSTRSSDGFSPGAQRWRVWGHLARLFKQHRIILSEEWLGLSKEEVHRWQETGPFVIAMHPHGGLPVGAILNCCTWASGGMALDTPSGAKVPGPPSPGPLLHQGVFPNIQFNCALASGCFLLPLFNEVYRKLGAIECTKSCMSDALRSKRTVAVCAGGATESRFATPGRYVCYCLQRRGFVRLALEERVNILHMWTFGDEGIMPQPWNLPKVLVRLQDFLKECTGLLLPPVPIGLPRFPPLTTVVGVPISLEDLWPAVAGGEVSEAAVTEAHSRYVAQVRKNFDENKALVPGGHEKAVLEIL